MANKIYVNDIGTVIRVSCGTTVSGATSAVLEIKKPDGSLVSWTASVAGEVLGVELEAGDLNLVGTYYIQPHLAISEWQGRAETAEMEVYDLFK